MKKHYLELLEDTPQKREDSAYRLEMLGHLTSNKLDKKKPNTGTKAELHAETHAQTHAANLPAALQMNTPLNARDRKFRDMISEYNRPRGRFLKANVGSSPTLSKPIPSDKAVFRAEDLTWYQLSNISGRVLRPKTKQV